MEMEVAPRFWSTVSTAWGPTSVKVRTETSLGFKLPSVKLFDGRKLQPLLVA